MSLNAPQASLGSVSIGGVQGLLSVSGDIALTGNLRQAFGNAVSGGPPNQTFGNLTSSNLTIQAFATIGTFPDTSPGTNASLALKVGNVSHTLTNQSVPILSSNGSTTYFHQQDFNYPSQTGPYPSGRMQVNDSNFSTDFRWLTKNPGAVGNSLVERLTLTSPGNVGINQPSPQYLFDVNGTAHANSVVVGNSPAITYILRGVVPVGSQTQNSSFTSVGDLQVPITYGQTLPDINYIVTVSVSSSSNYTDWYTCSVTNKTTAGCTCNMARLGSSGFGNVVSTYGWGDTNIAVNWIVVR